MDGFALTGPAESASCQLISLDAVGAKLIIPNSQYHDPGGFRNIERRGKFFLPHLLDNQAYFDDTGNAVLSY